MTAIATSAYAPRHTRGYRWRRIRGAAIFAAALSLFVIFADFPVYWMFVTAFKQVNDLYNLAKNPLVFNLAPTLEHVQFLLQDTRYLTWLVNTAEIGAGVVIVTLLVSVPAAYALARVRFRGSDSLGIGIFLTYLVPPTLLFLPLSQLVAGLGLVNTRWSLVLEKVHVFEPGSAEPSTSRVRSRLARYQRGSSAGSAGAGSRVRRLTRSLEVTMAAIHMRMPPI